MIDDAPIAARFAALDPQLDERGRRLFAACEVRAAGHGGLKAVSRITGLARSTILRGLTDLDEAPLPAGRVRRPGSGRHGATVDDPTLLDDLRCLVEPATLGDPMRPLLWVSKSLRKLSGALAEIGHSACPNTVRKLLGQIGYSRQGNRKSLEGRQHVDRDAQFEHINHRVRACQAEDQPVISVDTKKKELVGTFKNGGTDYRPEGQPHRVDVHDFPDKTLGKVVPYGIYDLAENKGWISLGIDHDTAEFAVNALRLWHERVGRSRYPEAKRLLITADCGGSNGVRLRLWKRELQRFADETGLTVEVCHYPPGRSKWNAIEHRLFCHITQTWRGQPLFDRMTIVDLIANTRTTKGLTVSCELDTRTYQKGIKVPDEDMRNLNIRGDEFHPEWNYSIKPHVENK